MSRTCITCGRPYDPHHPEAVRCIPCRDKRRRAKGSKGRRTHKPEKAREKYLRRRGAKHDAMLALKGARAEELVALVTHGREVRPDKPWLAPSFTPGQRKRVRRELDVEFRLATNLSDGLRRRVPYRKMRDYVREALVGLSSGISLEARLGYTMAELRSWLEGQFTEGMSWSAYREGRIHIDHVRALARFDMSDEAQFRKAWALSNLRPMWAPDNLRKGAR